MPGRNFSREKYRYGFNGKEKDKDVAASDYDFGARIYDGRIGRWLSVDPLADKYPSHAPYIFSANNPVLVLDVDGRDWIISTSIDSKGNKTVTIKLTAAIVNTSGTAVDLNKFKAAVISQLKTNFEKISYREVTQYTQTPNKSRLDGVTTGTGMIPSDFVNVSVKFDYDIRVVTNKEQQFDTNPFTTSNGLTTTNPNPFIAKDPNYTDTRRPDEHLIEIKADQELPNLYGKVNKIGGKELYLNVTKIANIISGKDNNTVFHELGHSLGLRHVDKKYETLIDIINGGNSQYLNKDKQSRDSNNAMFSGSSKYMNDSTSTNTSPTQFKRIIENIKKNEVNKK